MKKISLFFSLFMFLAFSMNAQYAFKVLAAKGSNQVLTSGAWNKISAGAKVNTGEKLKLTEGGYLGLIHKSGKTVELKTTGTFDVAELEAKVIAGKSNFGAKYGTFVADGMFAANADAKNSYDRTGSVHRGSAPSLIVYAPTETKALKSDPLTLRWNDCGEGQVYSITLSDYFGQVVYTVESKTNSVTIDFNKIEIVQEDDMDESLKQSYLLAVKSKTNSKFTSAAGGGHKYEIQLVDDVQEKEITSTINEVKTQIDATSALDQMVLAAAYEKQGLMTYAVSSYEKAQELAPGVDHFKTQYEEYIKVKLGLSSLKGKFDK